jgi:di/tricarboxylate transporter
MLKKWNKLKEVAAALVQVFAVNTGILAVGVIGLFALVAMALSNTRSHGSTGYSNSNVFIRSLLLLKLYI